MVIASTAEPEQLVALANELVGRAYASGKFMYVDTDLKYDQPQTEIVFDRDKVRSLGVDMSRWDRTCRGSWAATRQPVQRPGPELQGHSQIKRTERLTRSSCSRCTSPGPRQAGTLSTFASLATSTQPRELKRFQQLNAVRIQAVIPPAVPLDEALAFLETQARQMLPRGYTIDYAGESRQLRTEGGRFLGVFLLSGILIFLVLAAQFESSATRS